MVPGREICISDGNSIRRAKALEICPDGRLKVQEEDGTVSILSYGEVSIIIWSYIKYNCEMCIILHSIFGQNGENGYWLFFDGVTK